MLNTCERRLHAVYFVCSVRLNNWLVPLIVFKRKAPLTFFLTDQYIPLVS